MYIIYIFFILLYVLLLVHCYADYESSLKSAAGLYVDPTRTNNAHHKTVLVTAFNYAYLNHYHNFKCFIDRLGLKLVAVGFDQRTVNYLNSIGDPTVFPVLFDAKATENTVEFRKGDFRKISLAKFHVVHEFMKRGYNVVFSDPDVAIIRDPMHIFLHKDMDYMHSINARCRNSYKMDRSWRFMGGRLEGNTGFYFVRSTAGMIEFYQQFFDDIPNQLAVLDDQSLFWKFIRRRYGWSGSLKIIPRGLCPDRENPPDSLSGLHQLKFVEKNVSAGNLLSCFLDSCQFTAGVFEMNKEENSRHPTYLQEVLDELHDEGGKTLYTLHSNYISGNDKKQAQMAANRHWLATQGSNGFWNGKCISLQSLGGPVSYFNSSKYKGVIPKPARRSSRKRYNLPRKNKTQTGISYTGKKIRTRQRKPMFKKTLQGIDRLPRP